MASTSAELSVAERSRTERERERRKENDIARCITTVALPASLAPLHNPDLPRAAVRNANVRVDSINSQETRAVHCFICFQLRKRFLLIYFALDKVAEYCGELIWRLRLVKVLFD